jgi:GT2 family glycosyltransferase
MTKISIIIPNYNGASWLTDCLKSIVYSAQNCPSLLLETILVDNNSVDNSREIFFKISNKYPLLNPTFLRLESNFGFAGAVNQGIKLSKHPLIFVLNNDIKLSLDWFSKMIDSINKYHDYSIYYALVLNKNGSKIESTGFKYFMSGKCLNLNNHQNYIYKKRSSGFSRIWGAPASAIIYKKSAFKKVGLFDQRFFAYIEDVDLAYRLAKHNLKTLYIPSTYSNHLGGATSSKMGNLRAKMTYRNWHYLILKNYTVKEIFKYLPSIILERLKNLKYFFQSTPKLSFPFEYFHVNFQICRFFFTNLLKSSL